MAYVIKNTRNQTVATVADGAVDTTTNISLIGKNFVGYGQALNTNMIAMLEHFAGTSAPSRPILGQLWFDSSTSDLKVYNGSSFTNAVKAAANLAVVGNLSAGNITTGGAFQATGNLVGANVNSSGTVTAQILTSNIADGTAPIQVTSTTRIDNANVQTAGNLINGTSNVIVTNGGNVTVSVGGTPGLAVFTSTGANIAGYANITGNANITTINSGLMQNGNSNVTITANGAVSIAANGAVRMTVAANGYVGIGMTPVFPLDITAALGNMRLRSSTGTNYAQLQVINGSGTARFGVEDSVGGNIVTGGSAYSTVINQANAYSLHLGTNNTVRATIDSSGNVGIGTASPNTSLQVYKAAASAFTGTSPGGVIVTDSTNTLNYFTSLDFNTTNAPSVPYARIGMSYTSGGSTLSFGTSNSYASGITNTAMTIDASGNVGIGTSSPSAKLVVAGNILPSANATYNLGATGSRWSNIWGLSSSAQYADLAEKYHSDEDYPAGTVVMIGGVNEITRCNEALSTDVFGCISTNPAFLMNDFAHSGTWLPVVLTGRAPIMIAGKCKKGDRLVSAGNGAARVGSITELNYHTEIGRALHDKNTEEPSLIEAYISTR